MPILYVTRLKHESLPGFCLCLDRLYMLPQYGRTALGHARASRRRRAAIIDALTRNDEYAANELQNDCSGDEREEGDDDAE
jgi:hypothetical protein